MDIRCGQWSHDDFQTAYQCGHSTENALHRVHNDIVVTVGDGSFTVLLNLLATFHTIDHSNIFKCMVD